MKKRLIVLGSSGMAGHIITLHFRALTELYEVIDISRSSTPINPSVLMEITDFKLLKELITAKQPDAIINCIGILNQMAETNPDQAILINSYLPHFLEVNTRDTKCKVIHISTDCVFSGVKGSYIEDDVRDGQGFYAQSKALGEIFNHKDITVRTSIIGPELNRKGIGLFQWFLKQEGEIKGYTRAFWSGITTIQLAKAIESLLEQQVTGLCHLTNGVRISKYDLLVLFKEVFPTSRITYIEPVKKYRVDKSLLNTRTDINYPVPSYKEMIEEMKEWIRANRTWYQNYGSIIE